MMTDSNNNTNACRICGSMRNTKRCSSCQRAFYCSPQHQKEDWRSHKTFCQSVAKSKSSSGATPKVATRQLAVKTKHKQRQLSPNNSCLQLRNFGESLPVSRGTSGGGGGGQQQRVTSESEVLSDLAQALENNPTNQNGSAQMFAAKPSAEVDHVGHEMEKDVFFCGQFVDEFPMPAGNGDNSTDPDLLMEDDFYEREKQKRLLPSNTVPVNNNNYNLMSDFDRSLLNSGSEYAIPEFIDDEQQGLDEICRNLIRDMNIYGFCALDNFLGEERGKQVLKEVITMYSEGIFRDGQVVAPNSYAAAGTASTPPPNGIPNPKHIRGDKITWIDGKETGCSNIGYLINQVDSVVTLANKMANNGTLGNYTIKERTKAMVACYPGSGSHYVRHVDNPNKDGRCITAIYYLNRNWEPVSNGGLLRIFRAEKYIDIVPIFDRILFFWSDRRIPHEVQPAHRTRYAITLWYHDATERENALMRHQQGVLQQTRMEGSSANNVAVSSST